MQSNYKEPGEREGGHQPSVGAGTGRHHRHGAKVRSGFPVAHLVAPHVVCMCVCLLCACMLWPFCVHVCVHVVCMCVRVFFVRICMHAGVGGLMWIHVCAYGCMCIAIDTVCSRLRVLLCVLCPTRSTRCLLLSVLHDVHCPVCGTARCVLPCVCTARCALPCVCTARCALSCVCTARCTLPCVCTARCALSSVCTAVCTALCVYCTVCTALQVRVREREGEAHD